MSVIDDFFTIMQYYYDNKDIIGVDPDVTTSDDISRKADLEPLSDQGTYTPSVGDRIYSTYDGKIYIVAAAGTQWPEETAIISGSARGIDSNLLQIATDSKIQSINFFKATLDQIAFNSNDYNKMRQLFIDWYSSGKTFAEISRQSSDPNALNSSLLDLAIRSFGFNYSDPIYSKQTKVQFLLALAELYKKKGTPQAMVDALKFFGFDDISIYEWWIVRNDDNLYFQGQIIDTGNTRAEFPETRFMSWDQFAVNIQDPHWYYTREQILQLDQDPIRGAIGLPSLTPYFSVSAGSNLRNLTKNYAIINRIISDQYNNYISGDVPPQDIYVDTFDEYVSFTELYLGALYSYLRYNDFVKYNKLRIYISSNFGIDPENDQDPFTFEQPLAYEKLIYWAFNHRDEFGNNQPLDIGMIKDPALYPDWLQPASGEPFKFYPPPMEDYGYSVDITGGSEVEIELDYDESFIGFYDESIPSFPDLSFGIPFPLNSRQIYATSSDFPNYNQPINTISNWKSVIDEILEDYELVVERPTDYEDAEEKNELFNEQFTRLQRWDFIRNRQDPERVLQGPEPVETVTDLPDTGDEIGQTQMVFQGVSGEAEVYRWDGSNWVIVENGMRIGNLGMNNVFKTAIDERVGTDYFSYIDVAQDLLLEIDAFAATYIQQSPISLSRLLSDSDINNELLQVIDFWKPKRARLSSLELIGTVNEPVPDSINMKDEMSIRMEIKLPETSMDRIRGSGAMDYDEHLAPPDYVSNKPEFPDGNRHDENVTDQLVSITVYEKDPSGSFMLLEKDGNYYPYSLVDQADWAIGP